MFQALTLCLSLQRGAKSQIISSSKLSSVEKLKLSMPHLINPVLILSLIECFRISLYLEPFLHEHELDKDCTANKMSFFVIITHI